MDPSGSRLRRNQSLRTDRDGNKASILPSPSVPLIRAETGSRLVRQGRSGRNLNTKSPHGSGRNLNTTSPHGSARNLNTPSPHGSFRNRQRPNQVWRPVSQVSPLYRSPSQEENSVLCTLLTQGRCFTELKAKSSIFSTRKTGLVWISCLPDLRSMVVHKVVSSLPNASAEVKAHGVPFPVTELIDVCLGEYIPDSGIKQSEPKELFSIVFGAPRASVCVQAPDIETKSVWVRALKWLKHTLDNYDSETISHITSDFKKLVDSKVLQQRRKAPPVFATILAKQLPARLTLPRELVLRHLCVASKPPDSPEPFHEIGEYLMYYHHRRGDYPKMVYARYQPSTTSLEWDMQSDGSFRRQVSIKDVEKLHVGDESAAFGLERWTFSLVVRGPKSKPEHKDTFSFATFSEAQLIQWAETLQLLLEPRVETVETHKSNGTVADNADATGDVGSWGEPTADDFKFGKKLGEGASGEVFEAVHFRTKLEVAIKMLKETNDATVREIEVLKQCKHVNLVSYFGEFTKDKRTCLVMEHMDGNSLHALLRNKERLKEEHISYIARSTLLALQYLHGSRGLVHRDIKSGNIMLTLQGLVKLADFGVVMDLRNGSGLEMAGSPLWMSPEALEGHQPTPKVDVWALGITLLEIVHGSPPHTHLTEYSQIARTIIQNPAPRLQNYDGQWSPYFEDFVGRCLEKSLDQRWGVEELLQHPFITLDTAVLIHDPPISSNSSPFHSALGGNSLKRNFVPTTGRYEPEWNGALGSTKKDRIVSLISYLQHGVYTYAYQGGGGEKLRSRVMNAIKKTSLSFSAKAAAAFSPADAPAECSGSRRGSMDPTEALGKGLSRSPLIDKTQRSPLIDKTQSSLSTESIPPPIQPELSRKKSDSNKSDSDCSKTKKLLRRFSSSSEPKANELLKLVSPSPVNSPLTLRPSLLHSKDTVGLSRSTQYRALPHTTTVQKRSPAPPKKGKISFIADLAKAKSEEEEAQMIGAQLNSLCIGRMPPNFSHSTRQLKIFTVAENRVPFTTLKAKIKFMRVIKEKRAQKKLLAASDQPRRLGLRLSTAGISVEDGASEIQLETSEGTGSESDLASRGKSDTDQNPTIPSPKVEPRRKPFSLSLSDCSNESSQTINLDSDEAQKKPTLSLSSENSNESSNQIIPLDNDDGAIKAPEFDQDKALVVHPDGVEVGGWKIGAGGDIQAPNGRTHSRRFSTLSMDLEALNSPPLSVRSQTPVSRQEDLTSGSDVNQLEVEGDQDRGGLASTQMVAMGVIGRGQNGPVVKAFHVPSLTMMALKSMNVYDKGTRQQLLKELTAYARLDSPTLVSFLGAYYEAGKIVLCSEYMDQGSLSHFVKKNGGTLSEVVIKHIAKGAFAGLQYLHQQHQVHRDIKPDNILLSHRGEVKIGDFGLLKELSGTRASTKSFMGTMNYLSPERVTSEEYSYPCDVWAMGLSLLYCAIGYNPLATTDYWKLVDIVTKKPSPSLPNDKGFSPEFIDFIDRCLLKDPSKRATATELLSHSFLSGDLSHGSTGKEWELHMVQEEYELIITSVMRTHFVMDPASAPDLSAPPNLSQAVPTPAYRPVLPSDEERFTRLATTIGRSFDSIRGDITNRLLVNSTLAPVQQ